MKAPDRREATLDDVAKLQEMLKDPAQRDKAAKALENIGDQAGDARVQTAAEKALDDAKAQQGQPADQGKLPDKTSAPTLREKAQAIPPNSRATTRISAKLVTPLAIPVSPRRTVAKVKSAPPARMTTANQLPPIPTWPGEALPAHVIPPTASPPTNASTALPMSCSWKTSRSKSINCVTSSLLKSWRS